MKLRITKDSRVGEIKKEFSSNYPFLKLEFLLQQYFKTGTRHQIVNDNVRLADIRPSMKEGAMIVDDSTTVSELEAFFRNHLLDVQVFRRSDNLWLETTMTDAWTLGKQNIHGKEISESKHASGQGMDYRNGIISDVG